MNLSNKQSIRSITDIKQEYLLYFNRLLELSISMFEWTDLPDGIDSRFLEYVLFWNGASVFFRDNELDSYLALEVMLGGNFNVYRIPIERTAYAVNGYNKHLTDKDSIIIYNNMIHTNSLNEILTFSRLLYNIDNVIQININAQKTPLLLSCEEKQRLTLKNIYMKYDGNSPVIFGDKQLQPDTIKAINTQAPFLADKLYAMKTQIWNEALTYLGISNVNIQKRERLLNDEVHRNMGATISSRYSRLEARRQACEQINKMFGLNIWCNYREDYQTIDIEADDTISDNREGAE